MESAEGVVHGVNCPLSNPPFSMLTAAGHPEGSPDWACTRLKVISSERTVVAKVDWIGIFTGGSKVVREGSRAKLLKWIYDWY